MYSEEKKELVAIIGQLNGKIFDLEQNNERGATNNSKNMINFVNLGKNSPMMSSSAVDFLETERNAMKEDYETEIQNLKHSLMIEKESSKNTIESLQEKINTIDAQKAEIQKELEASNSQLLHFQALLEEQQSLNLAYESMGANALKQNTSINPEILNKLEKITKENEELKEKINELSKTINLQDTELQKQIQSNKTDRENFYTEIKRLTENSSSNIQIETLNLNHDAEVERERINLENSQLRSNLAHISSALQRAVNENSRLTDSLHLTEKKCADKIRNAIDECAQYKAVITSLQSLFNTENTTDILVEVDKLYQNSRSNTEYEHLQMLLKDEMRKNEELCLMVHMNAKIPSSNISQSPPSSPQIEDKHSNDAFLFRERVAQLEAEKENLSQKINSANEDCESLRYQLSQKDQIIEENKKIIKTLQDEADTLRGEILSQEEKLSQNIKDDSNDTNNTNNSQSSETEIKELLTLVASLREENDELRLTIGRKESGADLLGQNLTPTPAPNLTQESSYFESLQAQLSQIQQNVLLVAAALKQQVEMPTPAFASFTEFLEEKVANPLNENGEMNSFADESTALAEQISFDYKTLCLVQNQCVSAYDQMNKFFAHLKTISDSVENFYCSFDSIYESVCTNLNFNQEDFYGGDENFNGNENFDLNMNQKNITIQNKNGDVERNMMQMPDFFGKKSPKKTNGNSSFISLLDSPKIYRNALFDQDNINNNSDDEIKMDIDDIDEIPSLGTKNKGQKPSGQGRKQQFTSSLSSSNSSRIPKPVGSKNSKSRIPLTSKQNVFDQKMLSPRQAPSHIPELPTKKKNRFA